MYRLCSNGEHPLYEKGDTASTYVEKLRDPEWKFGPGFSKYAIAPIIVWQLDIFLRFFFRLAENLFLMLSKKVPTERYSASEALMHPWVTRKRNTLIPNKNSVFYTLMNLMHERKLKSAIQVIASVA